jgi:hypothetical protein
MVVITVYVLTIGIVICKIILNNNNTDFCTRHGVMQQLNKQKYNDDISFGTFISE